ncbi:hypothetical protein A2U01_0099334, partial [Trifolium medium]|nr:hypothetical protein [Trifolium medium]
MLHRRRRVQPDNAEEVAQNERGLAVENVAEGGLAEVELRAEKVAEEEDLVEK